MSLCKKSTKIVIVIITLPNMRLPHLCIPKQEHGDTMTMMIHTLMMFRVVLSLPTPEEYDSPHRDERNLAPFSGRKKSGCQRRKDASS